MGRLYAASRMKKICKPGPLQARVSESDLQVPWGFQEDLSRISGPLAQNLSPKSPTGCAGLAALAASPGVVSERHAEEDEGKRHGSNKNQQPCRGG